MRRVLVLLTLLLVTATLVTAPEHGLAQGIDVNPALDTNTFIVYQTQKLNVSVTTVAPSTFRIEWRGEDDRVVAEWWGPGDHPANYQFKVLVSRCEYYDTPPQIIELDNGARFLITWFTSLSVVAYADKAWWGEMYIHVKAVISIYAYVRIDRPPSEPTTIDLGQEISKLLYGKDHISVGYEAVVQETKPISTKFTTRGLFDINLNNIVLNFLTLKGEITRVSVTGLKSIASFTNDGYLAVATTSEIGLKLCLEGSGDYTLELKVSYYNQYTNAEKDVKLVAGSCQNIVLSDLVIPPGNYTSNNPLMIRVSGGAVSMNLLAEADVPGVIISVAKPFALIAKASNGTWYITLYTPVTVNSHNYGFDASVTAEGTVSLSGGTMRHFDCGSAAVTGTGSLMCQRTLPGIEIANATGASVTVEIGLTVNGIRNADETDALVAVLSPTAITGAVHYLYEALASLPLYALLIFSVLLVINTFIKYVSGKDVIPYQHIIDGLRISLAATILVYLVPIFAWIVLTLIRPFPEFGFLSRTPVGDPNTLLTMKPADAMTMLYTTYDMLFTEMRANYNVWVWMPISTGLVAYLQRLAIVTVGAIALAMILIITLNSGVGGSLAASLLSFMVSLIVPLFMFVPALAAAVVFLSIAEAITQIILALVVIFTTVGIVLLLLPMHSLRNLAVNFVTTGFLYLLTIPVMGPVLYAMYGFIMQRTDMFINELAVRLGSFQISLATLGLVSLVPPLDVFARVVAYVATTTAFAIVIVVSQAAVLARFGVLSSLASAITQIMRK